MGSSFGCEQREQRKLSGTVGVLLRIVMRIRVILGVRWDLHFHWMKAPYVCDSGNNRIRAVDTTSGDTRTVGGSGELKHTEGIGTAASIYFPRFCDWDRASGIEPFTSLISARKIQYVD
jgi:hypothetical protein